MYNVPLLIVVSALSYTMLDVKHSTRTETNETFQINITSLNIPTSKRLASWLFTSKLIDVLNWDLQGNKSS